MTRPFRRLAERMSRRRRERHTRQALRHLEPRILRDIGLSVEDLGRRYYPWI